MDLGLRFDAVDSEYLARRGGPALYSHFRGAPARCTYRRRALERAGELYADGLDRSAPDPEAGGLGLLVLQRAVLCVEDLGALLHALRGNDPWPRLTGYAVPDIDEVFLGAHRDPAASLRPLRLPDTSTLEKELGSGPALDGAREIVRRTQQRWLRMLEGVANLWLRHRDVAKATMHGYPIMAGEYAIGPPPAGHLSESVRDPGVRPFVVPLISRAHKTGVHTDVHTVPLDRDTVSAFLRNGKLAVRLTEQVCAAQADGIARGYDFALPLEFAHRLPQEQRRALEELTA